MTKQTKQKIDINEMKKSVQDGVEITCEKCNDYCDSLNCKYFINDIVEVLIKTQNRWLK